MKGAAAAAADPRPYEFFRWKSSRGRLAVRTTWVKGVRHVILSDDEVTDERPPPSEKEKRPRLQHKNGGGSSSNRPPLSVVDANGKNDNNNNNNDDDDDSYVERVLQWLHKPSGGVLETCQKPMSAPGNGGGGGGFRRPALIKTFSIPENKSAHQQVAGATRRPTTCGKSSSGGCTKNRQKTELHVHMPSTCPASNGKTVHDDFHGIS